MSFSVKYNSAKICWTRNTPGPDSKNNEECRAASDGTKVTFQFDEPCENSGGGVSYMYGDCGPIFFYIEGMHVW